MTLQQFSKIISVYYNCESNDETNVVIDEAFNAVHVAYEELSNEDKETFELLCDERLEVLFC